MRTANDKVARVRVDVVEHYGDRTVAFVGPRRAVRQRLLSAYPFLWRYFHQNDHDVADIVEALDMQQAYTAWLEEVID